MNRIEQIVRDIVRARTSREVALDDASLGLDSIALAEVLLDCEQRFVINVTALLEGEPLTLRKLIAHLEQETPA